MKRHTLKLKAQAIKIREQERKIQEHTAKMHEQEATIADLRKHIDEWEQRFSDLTAEVRAKDDHMNKTAGGLAPPPPLSSIIPSPKYHHLPNIKPRKAQVLPPKAFSVMHAELERKRKGPSPLEIPNKMPRNVGNIDLVSNHAVSSFAAAKFETDPMSLLAGAGTKEDLAGFTTNVIGTLLANPIIALRSRKRKLPEGLEMLSLNKWSESNLCLVS